MTNSEHATRSSTFLHRKQTEDSQYQKKSGWVVFAVVFSVVLLLNLPFMIASLVLRPRDLRYYLRELEKEFKRLKGIQTVYETVPFENWTDEELSIVGTTTVEMLQQQGADLEQEEIKLYADFDLISAFSIATAVIHLVLLLVSLGLVIRFRSSKIVKSRGRYFIVQLFISGFFGTVFATCLSSLLLLETNLVPGSAAFDDAFVAFAILTFFFTIQLYASMTSRMR
eukprot:Awhi_evm1s3248